MAFGSAGSTSFILGASQSLGLGDLGATGADDAPGRVQGELHPLVCGVEGGVLSSGTEGQEYGDGSMVSYCMDIN